MNRSLPNLIKDITLFFIKHHYDKYLVERSIKLIEESELRNMIDDIYFQKQQELRDYIRQTLKANLKDEYSSASAEMIINEMFNDPKVAKERVIIEILQYQKKI